MPLRRKQRRVLLVALLITVILFFSSGRMWGGMSSDEIASVQRRYLDIEKRISGDVLPLHSPPWLVWYGYAPVAGHEAKSVNCPKGKCQVFHQPDKKGTPRYVNKHARAVLLYGTDFFLESAPLPRLKQHVWALLHEESPKNQPMLSHADAIELFNITATFRQGSDMPMTLQFLPSYEYLLSKGLPVEEKNSYRRGADKLAPVVYVQSTCDNPAYRDFYVKELMQHIQVDALGGCLRNRHMPTALEDPMKMFSDDFYTIIKRYKFILAFENGICPDYITEKLWRPLHLGIVPIYRGAPNIHEWLPSTKSALVYEDFDSPHALAEFIKYLDGNDAAYNEYLEFKMGGDHITNNKLKRDLRDRKYSPTPYERNELPDVFAPERKPDMVDVLECIVCDFVLEQQERERKGLGPAAPKMANQSHYGCPAPVAPKAYTADWSELAWESGYTEGARQAAILKRMVMAGETDASRSFRWSQL